MAHDMHRKQHLDPLKLIWQCEIAVFKQILHTGINLSTGECDEPDFTQFDEYAEFVTTLKPEEVLDCEINAERYSVKRVVDYRGCTPDSSWYNSDHPRYEFKCSLEGAASVAFRLRFGNDSMTD